MRAGRGASAKSELEPARRHGVSTGVQTRWRKHIKIMQLPKAKARQREKEAAQVFKADVT